jgi:hypothetical protein
MSTAVQAPAARTEIIHNNRFLMAIYACLAVVSWICAPFFVIEGLSMFVPLRSVGFMRVLYAVQWLLGSFGMAYTGRLLWNMSVKKWRNRVELDATGVRFCCKLQDGKNEWYTPLDQIESVTCATSGGVQTFRVQTFDPGSYFTYNSYTFTRPKTIAERVAAACGKSLEFVK